MAFDEARRDAFAERLFQMTIATLEAVSIYLGDRLGLYGALAEGGAQTSAELAARAGVTERYAREWLEQQAVAGLLDVDSTAAAADSRRYSISPEHAEVLTDRNSLAYMAPFPRLALSAAGRLPAITEAYRRGGGVAWDSYGPDAFEGQSDANRPLFLGPLGTEWLPSIPDVDARLRKAGARIADIACGGGWSSIGMALAYPGVRVDGYDLDEASVNLAKANAVASGVADRVSFYARDAGDIANAGKYDLVTVFEALHDMSQPVGVLAAMRHLVNDSGAVLVVDENVAERFTAPGDAVERMMYGWSVSICLPNGLAESPSVGTGTVLRPATLEAYARDAGFARVEILPIEHDFFRVYRLYQ